MVKMLRSIIVLGIAIILFSSSLGFVSGMGNPEPIQEPLSEPDLPSATAFDPWPTWTGDTIYHTWEEMVIEMEQTVTDHSDIVKMVSIGTSWQGRDIWAIKISDNPEIEEPDEPEVFFNGNHHAREWLTIEINLYAIAFFTDNYGINATVTDIVDSRQLWIVPCVNPDGRIIDSIGDNPADHIAQPYGWRKNARDNNGNEVFEEAFDGVDPNRNYDWMWGSSGASSDPSSYTYGGPSGFSEPETQAIRDFCREHDFVFALNYHTYSQLILYPWGWTYDNTPDHDIFVSVAWELEARITNTVGSAHDGYVPEQGADLYPTSGGSDDWQYGELGILAYTIEAFPYYDWDGGGPENHWSIQDPWDLFHPMEDTVLPVCQDNIHAFVYICQISGNPFQVMDHIEITTVEEELIIDGGASDSTTIDLLNNGQRDDDFTITTSTLPGWTITPAPASHNILRNLTAQLTLSITVPGAQAPGEYTIWVNVSSDTNSTCTDSCQLTVIVPYPDDVGVDSQAPFIEQAVYPMGEYRINGTVMNYGDLQVPSFDTTCTIYQFGGGTNYNLFSDDMESGMGQWFTEDWDSAITDDYWHIVNTRSNSPSNSMWCGPAGGGIYADYAAQFLYMADTIDLRNASSATLSYWSSYDVENTYDFCMVEGSDDGGQTWEFIARYTGTENTWIERIHDLSNFTGSTEFKLRFRFTSDGGTGAAGFWLDDLSIDAFIPGETIVFGPASLPTSGPLDPLNSEVLQWQYDFAAGGTYRVSIETGYGADGNPANDLLDVIFDIDPNTHLPDFAGVDRVENPGTGSQLDIYWEPANDVNLPITYTLYRFDHEPDEAEVNGTAPIWTGAGLSYNDALLTSGQQYFYVVRAMDSLGQQDWNMNVVNATPAVLFFFQIQSPIAGYKNLNSDPFEIAVQTSETTELSAVGQYRIGGADDHWVSEVFAQPQSMDGTWHFNLWGRISNSDANGNLYARVYRYSDDGLLFETGLDDEDISLYTASHEFNWQYDVSGVTLPAGDRYYVEIWVDISSASGIGQFGETLNPDFTANADDWIWSWWEDGGDGSPSGSWQGAGYVDLSIQAPTGGSPTEATYGAFWQQTFTTGFIPDNAELILDWSSISMGSGDSNMIAYAFIDTVSMQPAVGTEVWTSGVITSTSGWASVGPIDVSGIVNADTTYYLKVAFRDTDVARNEGTRTIGFDNVQVSFSSPPPVFTMEYDHSLAPSSIEAALTPVAGMTYDIDLSGLSGQWAFVSFPIACSGSPLTILDDAVHGDANTTWDMIQWYDANDANDHWKSYNKLYPGTQDLPSINNLMGVWLHITSNTGDQMLTIGTGTQPVNTTIDLKVGWNMVGYPSATPRQADAALPVEVTKIAFYNASQAYSIQELPPASVTMSSGNAYWVYTPVDVGWVIDW